MSPSCPPSTYAIHEQMGAASLAHHSHQYDTTHKEVLNKSAEIRSKTSSKESVEFRLCTEEVLVLSFLQFSTAFGNKGKLERPHNNYEKVVRTAVNSFISP